MNGHPALLAPPPPLANLTQEASTLALPPEHGADSEETAQTDLLAGLTNAESGINAASATTNATSGDQADITGQIDAGDPVVANERTVSTEQIAAKENTEAPKKFKDFLGQVTDIAFGPNYEKAGPDYKAYEKTLVSQSILPAFAISDDSPAPLKIALNMGQDRTQQQLNYYRDRYFELKTQA